MRFSIIIPALNEELYIGRLLGRLIKDVKSDDHEVIVVDGGSEDRTIKIAEAYNVFILHSDIKNRAAQMNLGAKHASGQILLFVHADVLIDTECFNKINKAIGEGKEAGCFSYKFESKKWLLKINAKFTRTDSLFSGGGDQTLFIKKSLFEEIGGFNEEYVFMEDFELTQRLRKKKVFITIPHDITVSARKYKKNSYLKVQLVNLFVFTLFKMKVAPTTLARYYKRLLK